jgi:hypothetical protein
MLATAALGEAFESPNLHTHVFRSKDCGATWLPETHIECGVKGRITSNCARITALPGSETIAFMVRHDRTAYRNQGLTNPQTLGFVPTELLLARSRDYGRTWSPPQVMRPPLTGPSFEMCAPITLLRDGRWVLPTSTWPGWDGRCPNGIQMVGLISRDRGLSWKEYMKVMQAPRRRRIFFWESKIVELADGTLLAAAWAYDDQRKRDLPNQYVLSADGGRTWSAPRSTGLRGQTLTPFLLADGRILCVYRRLDKTGLWANLSYLKGGRWINIAALPLWGAQTAGLTSHSRSMSRNFGGLRFGAPSIARAPDGAIFVAFWCYEDCVSVIRWFKLEVRT